MIAREHKENFRDAVWGAVKALAAVSGQELDEYALKRWIIIGEQAITRETFFGKKLISKDVE